MKSVRGRVLPCSEFMVFFKYTVLIRGSVHMFGLLYVHQKMEDFFPSLFVTLGVQLVYLNETSQRISIMKRTPEMGKPLLQFKKIYCIRIK